MADNDNVIACSAAVLFCVSAYLFKFKAAYSMGKALRSEKTTLRCVQHIATQP